MANRIPQSTLIGCYIELEYNGRTFFGTIAADGIYTYIVQLDGLHFKLPELPRVDWDNKRGEAWAVIIKDGVVNDECVRFDNIQDRVSYEIRS